MRWCLLALLLLLPTLGNAAPFEIMPIRVDLSPHQRAAAVSLRNTGEEEMLVQASTFAWLSSSSPADLSPTRDIVVVPAVINIPPGKQQLFRIATRKPVDPEIERTYRIILSQVPPEQSGPRTGFITAYHLSLPVFVTPAKAAPAPVWSIERRDTHPVLKLTNSGTAHLHLRRITAFEEGTADPLFEFEAATKYVLASQQDTWQLPRSARGPLVLKVETNLGQDTIIVPLSED